MDDIAVIVATFGSREWEMRGNRALDSVYQQSHSPDEIIRLHRQERTLAQVRNEAVGMTGVEWCVFLDADDELDPYYLAGMVASRGDVRVPRLQKVYPDRTEWGDGICIGAMFRKDWFVKVGGFRELPILEDLDLWERMRKAGAAFGKSQSVYRALVREDSRNSDERLKQEWIEKILS